MNFLALLFARVYSIPYYIIWLVGIVYAIVNRRKHPRTSLFAGIAFGILLAESLASAVGSAYIQYQSFTSDLPARELGANLTILSLCTLPFSILGWILLLVAIFGRGSFLEREATNDSVDGDILL